MDCWLLWVGSVSNLVPELGRTGNISLLQTAADNGFRPWSFFLNTHVLKVCANASHKRTVFKRVWWDMGTEKVNANQRSCLWSRFWQWPVGNEVEILTEGNSHSHKLHIFNNFIISQTILLWHISTKRWSGWSYFSWFSHRLSSQACEDYRSLIFSEEESHYCWWWINCLSHMEIKAVGGSSVAAVK